MDQKQNVYQPFGFMPSDIEGVDNLVGLALDMRWSWNHAADEIWRQLDPALWELTHNPWIILMTLSRETLKNRLADPAFRDKVNGLEREKEEAETHTPVVPAETCRLPLKTVAYFSMEYMLSEALPIYVGGLGNVAGDQLKSAADLGCSRHGDRSALSARLFPSGDRS